MAVPVAEAPKKAPDYASLAANLANNNRKVIAPQPPKYDNLIPHFHGHGRSKSTNTPSSRISNSNINAASSKATLRAHNSRRPSSRDGPISARPPQAKQTLESQAAKQALDTRAAAIASTLSWNKSSQRPVSQGGLPAHASGDRAAAAASKSWTMPGAAQSSAQSVYGVRGEQASPAVAKAWGAQKTPSYKPVVAPLSAREQAMIQAKINARRQESTDRRERKPIIKIGAEFLGEHPPVRLEREEKAHKADLHEQAVALAKLAYARQQSNQMNHASIGSQAQQLANDKLAKLNKTDNDLDTMRSYYGTPAPPPRSKSHILLRRSKSQASRPGDAEDVAQSWKIRSQMNLLRAQIDQVDANQQEQDRKRLIEAARKKVQGDMLKMDEVVYKDTGKMSKAMMDDWDNKARDKQRQTRSKTPFQGLGMEPDRAVNIGGRLVDQTEIDQLAVSRVKPTLAGIDEAVQKKRDVDEQKAEEKEERKREKEKHREEKAESKREKAEEKRKVKEQKAVDRADGTDGEEKHSSLAAKLPALPKFGRHKRNESTQTAQTDQTDRTEEEEQDTQTVEEAEKKKSPVRVPGFAKYSHHRRTESAEHVSEDDTHNTEETPEKRRLLLFNKLSRRSRSGTVENNDVPETVEQRKEARSTSPTPNSKSLKSRLTKLVHRHQFSDALEHQEQEPSFEPRRRSVSTELEGESTIISDDEHPVTKEKKSIVNAPNLMDASIHNEGRVSLDDRNDELYGKHLPSKFQENI
jgi:hypothetical protein